ncbi:MAG: hypothetical protein U1F53_05245 [Burkholderiaceae bacterium]
MKLMPLGQVAGQLKSGSPLPFSVRDAQGGLLLARGNLISGDAMRQTLLERGAFVDADEVKASQRDSSLPSGERRFNLWRGLMTRLSVTLQEPGAKGLETSVRGVATELASLVQADPDMAQAVLVHPELCEQYPYSVAHSAHAAATWALIALRQEGATPASLTVPLAAALTMNLSMLLADRLTHQEGPLRSAARADPAAPEAERRDAARGRGDRRAVAGHGRAAPRRARRHRLPRPIAEPPPEARRLHLIDVYCACFGGRGQGVRRCWPTPCGVTSSTKDPTALALAKEFGLTRPAPSCAWPRWSWPWWCARCRRQRTVRLPAKRRWPGLAPPRPGEIPASPATPWWPPCRPRLPLRVRVPWAQLFTLF